jgi:phage-related protein
MKTLIIRDGEKLTVRAIASESATGGRDPCETLAFFQHYARANPKEMIKLGALLDETSEHGPPHDEKKFRKLPGTDGLYEFKTYGGLRLLCFWDEAGLIVCTHGYVKDSQKAPKNELGRAEKLKREYFVAKNSGALIHVPRKR